MIDWMKRHPPPGWVVALLWGFGVGIWSWDIVRWLKSVMCAAQ